MGLITAQQSSQSVGGSQGGQLGSDSSSSVSNGVSNGGISNSVSNIGNGGLSAAEQAEARQYANAIANAMQSGQLGGSSSSVNLPANWYQQLSAGSIPASSSMLPISSLGPNGPSSGSSFLNMLKPSPQGGRRSLTNRLRNFVNSIFRYEPKKYVKYSKVYSCFSCFYQT